MIRSKLEKNIMTTHDESPIIRTSKKRLAQGIAIVVAVMAVGAAIAISNWNQMAQNPPPVSTIVVESPAAPEGEDEIQEGTEESKEGERVARLLQKEEELKMVPRQLREQQSIFH